LSLAERCAPFLRLRGAMTAKPIPIIDSPMEAGDQAVRAEYEKLIADLFLSFSAMLTRLQTEINLKFADVLAELEEEEEEEDGVSHS
jgi:hypothetical protein